MKKKKPFFLRWWFLLLLALFLIYRAGGKTETPVETDPPGTIYLRSDEPGEYGRPITLNAGTDSPDTFIGFFVPPGRYAATSAAAKYHTPIFVYRDEYSINSSGYEEHVGGDQYTTLAPGETWELTVDEGEYIKLGDNRQTIKLVPLAP